MKRLELLMLATTMTALLAAVVVFFSPYAPTVEPMKEIEEIWAIEDAREESSVPLLTCLENNGMRLGYDAQQNTFYCTIGLGNGETWPEIHLTAPGAKGVKLCFVDDYTYDWCDEAVREGYAYQVLAYTEEEFWYTQVVFTGMTVICLETDEAVSLEDQPGRAAISACGSDPIQADARISYRGASSVEGDKKGYKIKFVGNRSGEGIEYDVPGIGMESRLALLPMLTDAMLMQERLCWDLYAAVVQDGAHLRPRKTQYIELFVNDEYAGVYLMINLVDVQKELRLAGESHVREDSVYRSCYVSLERTRITVPDPVAYHKGWGYELHRSTRPGSEFDDLQPYLALRTEQDDEAFARRALEMIDLEQVLRYHLFLQGCCLTDNAYNNMFIWTERTQDGVRYSFYPWDLDQSWGYHYEEDKSYTRWFRFPLADRLINLDAGGARSRLAQLWQSMREDVFTQENIAGLLEQYAIELADSGAMMRNEERWGTGIAAPEGQGILDFAATRFFILDELIAGIAGTEGRIDFLNEDGGETVSIKVIQEEGKETGEEADK